VRTTLTLDDDVAARLTRLREERRLPLKQLVNEALRRGLAVLDTPPPASRGPATSPVSLGGALLPDVDDVAETLAVAEGDARR
jgi:hypothetical protein